MPHPRLRPLGFHGDLHLLDAIASVTPRVTHFVETGTGTGSTAKHFAETHPEIPVRTCEANAELASSARDACRHLRDVEVHAGDSKAFLEELLPSWHQDDLGLFLLDAHGGWSPGGAFTPATGPEPLDAELELITKHRKKAVILIDDAPVPGMPQFRHSAFINMTLIRTSLASGRKYRFWAPKYTDRTSKFHPLTGYVFVTYGVGQLTVLMRTLTTLQEI